MPKLSGFSIKQRELKHKIEILRCSNSEDNEDCIPYETDFKVIRVARAKVKNSISEDTNENGGTSTVVTKSFYIRYSKSDEITCDDKVRYNGNIYSIETISDVLDSHMWIQITCKVVT